MTYDHYLYSGDITSKLSHRLMTLVSQNLSDVYKPLLYWRKLYNYISEQNGKVINYQDCKFTTNLTCLYSVLSS